MGHEHLLQHRNDPGCLDSCDANWPGNANGKRTKNNIPRVSCPFICQCDYAMLIPAR